MLPCPSEWALRFFLQARDDPSLLVPAALVWREQGSTLRYLDRRFDKPQERLLAGLGQAARFWELREGLGDFRVTIAPPPVETALLKRLGSPLFSRRPEAFVGALTLAYASVTDRALALAFEEESE